MIDAINQGREIVERELEILRRLELIKDHLDPEDIKHKEISDAINRGRDTVRGNLDILEYLGLVRSMSLNGGEEWLN